eukprot:s23_g16.t1
MQLWICTNSESGEFRQNMGRQIGDGTGRQIAASASCPGARSVRKRCRKRSLLLGSRTRLEDLKVLNSCEKHIHEESLQTIPDVTLHPLDIKSFDIEPPSYGRSTAKWV